MNEAEKQLHSTLACLADPSRFRIALLLRARAYFVSELAAALGKSQSCTTRHLQAMTRVGLVRGQREGRRVVFRIESGAEMLSALGRDMAGVARVEAPVSNGDSGAAADAAPADAQRPGRPRDLEDFLL